MRMGYLDCFSGISGDMLLGAMVDAGVPLAVLQQTAEGLQVGARLEARKVVRGGITGTKVDVLTGDSASHSHEPHEHTHEPAHEHTHADGHTHSHEHSHEHTHSHDHGHAEKHAHSHSHKHEHTHEHHRSLTTILGIIDAAPLAGEVKERAAGAFRL